jgi:hypothetical protein
MSEKMKPENIWSDLLGKGEVFITANAIDHLIENEKLYPSPMFLQTKDGQDADVIGLVVLCNDLFWWACADYEPVSWDDIQGLYEECFDRNCEPTPWGDAIWACKRREMRPQHPVEEAMRKAGAWTDELEALPVREFTG